MANNSTAKYRKIAEQNESVYFYLIWRQKMADDCNTLIFFAFFHFHLLLFLSACNRNILLTLIMIKLSSAICELNSRSSYCNSSWVPLLLIRNAMHRSQRQLCINFRHIEHKHTHNLWTEAAETSLGRLLREVGGAHRTHNQTRKTKSCERIHMNLSGKKMCIPIT